MTEYLGLIVISALIGIVLWFYWRTPLSAMVFALVMLISGSTLLETLARPKPIQLEWREMNDRQIHWYQLKEGEAIYLIIDIDGTPRYYILPWNPKQAEQLTRARRRQMEQGGQILFGDPLSTSLGPDPIFHLAPPPPPPLKQP